MLLYNSPFTSENNVNYQSGFIRDNWRIGDRLTLNVGLRFERYDVFLPEQSKPAGPFSAAADYPHIDLYDWRALAPRVGMSYALTADNRTVVKATYGRFNHAIRAVEHDDPPQPQRERVRGHPLSLERSRTATGCSSTRASSATSSRPRAARPRAGSTTPTSSSRKPTKRRCASSAS